MAETRTQAVPATRPLRPGRFAWPLEWRRNAGRSIAALEEITEKIEAPASAGREPYTPFVPFSPRDDLTLAEIRDFLGFLKKDTIQTVLDFLQAEAMSQALAEDLRSEYVRRELAPDRKIALLHQYSNEVVRAFDAGEKALKALNSS